MNLGLRYDYATSDEANPDYWTPYRLNRFYAEVTFRKTFRRIYYNFGIRYGFGKQELRPQTFEKYRSNLAQLQQDLQTAIRKKWSSTAIANLKNYYSTLLANPPEETSWEPVLELVASTQFKLGKGKHWAVNGEVSYNTVPDYNALLLLGGIQYLF